VNRTVEQLVGEMKEDKMNDEQIKKIIEDIYDESKE